MLYPFAFQSAILEPPRPPVFGRLACRVRAVEAVKAAGGPLTGKEIVQALRPRHGRSTVLKALAELTAAGTLVNPRDAQGYRLAGARN